MLKEKWSLFLIVIMITISFINVHADDQFTVYKNGSIIYFNPETGEKCDDYKEENSIGGVKNGCLKWYAFNDAGDSSPTLKLLLDHNTTKSISDTEVYKNDTSEHAPMWMKENFHNGISQILKEDTSSWNQSLSPRLISLYEVYDAIGVKKDTEAYQDPSKSIRILTPADFNDYNMSDGSRPYFKTEDLEKRENGWIFTNLSEGSNPNNYGLAYYTSTKQFEDSSFLTTVLAQGLVGNNSHDQYYLYGIRPIITISKTSLIDQNIETKKDQTVQVGNTLKDVYISYCIGLIILILGVMIVIQGIRKYHLKSER